MIVYRVVGIALVLAWPLLAAQGCAQGVWPFDRSTTGLREEQLHRLFDRGPGLAVIFKGMERAFVPERARGFEGEIRYELRGRDGERSWTVRIGDGRAAVRRGAPAGCPASRRRTAASSARAGRSSG